MAEKDLAQNAVERLSEDEALRGDLSDIGFGPLLDWATAAVTAYAAHATDEAAVDQYTDRVRGVVQSAVADADAGQIDPVTDLLDFDPADKAATEAALKALKLTDDSDQNAVDIAGVLQAGLSPANSNTESKPPDAAPSQTSSNNTEAEQPKPATTTATDHTEIPTMASFDKTTKTSIEPKAESEHSHTEHKEAEKAEKAKDTEKADAAKGSKASENTKEPTEHKESKESNEAKEAKEAKKANES